MRRPWFRSLTFWFGILVFLTIIWSWIDSRYHRTVFISGGPTGVGFLNNRSAIALTYWINDVAPYYSMNFRVDDRSPEDWTWIRWFGVTKYEHRTGHTVHLPHYMLLLAWIGFFSLAMIARALWIWRVSRKMSERISASDDNDGPMAAC